MRRRGPLRGADSRRAPRTTATPTIPEPIEISWRLPSSIAGDAASSAASHVPRRFRQIAQPRSTHFGPTGRINAPCGSAAVWRPARWDQ
jgi:hypothetical protein